MYKYTLQSANELHNDHTMLTHVSKVSKNTSATSLLVSAFLPPKKTALTRSTLVKVNPSDGGGPWPVVGGTPHSPVGGEWRKFIYTN